MSYDPACYDLAETFLNDISRRNPPRHGDIDALAQRIQETIEDFIAEIEEKKER